MNTEKKSKNAAFAGIFAAIAASSCCIPPFIAAIAGVGGAAGSLSWMEPFRPYLIGLAVVSIGYAWYNHFRTKSTDDCGCAIEKPKWYQTRGYLVGITLFAALSIAFPYYAHVFYGNNKKEVVIVNQADIREIQLDIKGMTCEACEEHVIHAVNELDGIVDVNASYTNANAEVKYDKTKTSIEDIMAAINSTGYQVVE